MDFLLLFLPVFLVSAFVLKRIGQTGVGERVVTKVFQWRETNSAGCISAPIQTFEYSVERMILLLIVDILAAMIVSMSLGLAAAGVISGILSGALWAVLCTIDSLETELLRKAEKPEWS